MRLTHIIETVYARPWSITPAGWEAIHRIVQSKLSGEIIAAPAAVDEDDTDLFGDPLPSATLSDDGTLTIPIQGVIGRKIGMIGRACGGCDLMDVERDLAKASNPAVSRVILDIDSPGGSVAGVPELAARIKAAADAKPVFAFTDGMMCSAAYWLASQADAIYATKTADVGSIGVYMAILDEARAYEMAGVKVELFKAGRLKAMGMPGTTLTEEAREHLQSEVDDIYQWFTSDVRFKRDVSDDVMQGQSFMGEAAAKHDLIDMVVPSLADAVEEIKTKTNRERKW